MANQILDAPEYSFEEIQKNLLKAGLKEVYETKNAIIVKETDEVRAKIIQDGNGYRVQPMWAPVGNGAQAIFTIAFIFLFGKLGVPLFFLAGILVGFGASHLYYYPKCTRLKDRVERLMGNGAQTPSKH
jgi:hypothetical protein